MTGNSELSERELEILRLISTGASNKEIAQELFISTNTVKVHLRNIYAKIGVESRTEAAMFAVNGGLFTSTTRIDTEIVSDQSLLKDDFGKDLTHVIEKKRSPQVALIISTIIIVPLVILFLAITRPFQTNVPNLVVEPTAVSRLLVLESMPTPRTGSGVIAYENDIYVIAGRNDSGPTDIVELYDPDKDTWLVLAPKQIPVTDIQAVVLGDKIYVPGGKLATGLPTDVVEIYDPRQNRWTTGVSLPIAVNGYSLVSFEGKLYLFGGWDGTEYLDTVYAYDPETGIWEEKTPMKNRRAFTGATVATGKIFLMGGINANGPLNLNEIYQPGLDDGLNDPWSIAKPLPGPRYGMGLTTIADVIYLVGGKTSLIGNVNNYLYVPQTNMWQDIDLPSSEEWYGLGLVPIGLRIFGVGGQIDNTITGQNLSYQAIYLTVFPVIP